MPLAEYPTTIPYKPTLDGFVRQEHHRPVVRTEVEDGPDIMRVQSQTRIKKFRYRLIFTDAEYAIWEDFVENTLDQATAHFLMQVPVLGTTYVERRVYIDGAQWQDEAFGLLWAVSFVLCVFPSA